MKTKNTRQGSRLFLFLVSFALGSCLSYPYLQNARYAEIAALGTTIRPFVYRALMPTIAQILIAWTGLPAPWFVFLLFGLSGVAFAFSLYYFIGLFIKPARLDLLVIGLFLLFVFLFSGEWVLIYDLPTAAFMTLLLGLMFENRLKEYLFIFTFAAFNRETVIVLLPVFLFVYWDRLPWAQLIRRSAEQLTIFAIVQISIRWIFRHAPGQWALIEPWQNVQRYINHPMESLWHICILAGLLFLILKDWHQKPYFLTRSFSILFPLFLGMYFIFGQTFEYRVFIEVFPVGAALLMIELKTMVIFRLPGTLKTTPVYGITATRYAIVIALGLSDVIIELSRSQK